MQATLWHIYKCRMANMSWRTCVVVKQIQSQNFTEFSPNLLIHQGPVSISEKTSYRKISWSLEATRFVFRVVRSLWNLTGTSAALLPMCLSNFKAIRLFKVPISWLRDFTRSYDKTSFRILRRGPEPNKSPQDVTVKNLTGLLHHQAVKFHRTS